MMIRALPLMAALLLLAPGPLAAPDRHRPMARWLRRRTSKQSVCSIPAPETVAAIGEQVTGVIGAVSADDRPGVRFVTLQELFRGGDEHWTGPRAGGAGGDEDISLTGGCW